MDLYEWLGTWEPGTAPGRHSSVAPAMGARGYQFFPRKLGDRRPKPPEPMPTMWDRVGRAIPVDGTVGDPPASWEKSPQARYWLEKEKPGILRRILAWLTGPANKDAARNADPGRL